MNLNLTTTTFLLSWPLVAIWLYKTRSIGQATLWTILGAYMVLPVGAYFKFAMIPQLDKSSIPNIVAFVSCLIVLKKRIRLSNGFGLAELFILTLLIGPFITSEMNGDTIVVGGQELPGVGVYDAGSAVVAQLIALLPFFIGRQVLRNRSDTEEILRVLIIAGLMYSLPMLFEIRMSPQLHTWVYGYFPGQFVQAYREGGFRPVVFMGHGLLVAFFIMTTAVAAAAFWRTGTQVTRVPRIPAGATTIYLSGLLMLCKTLSALLYGAILVPLVRFARPHVQVKIALAMVSLALLYPTLRAADLVPTKTALNLAASVELDRARSLETRFKNEDQLLERASQRFFFGWGRYGRSRIYNDYGGDDSLTDGRWIITMGQFGFIGFLAEFGLLALPVFRAASALRFAPSTKAKVFLAALTVILAINMVDLIPNSSLRPWTWLLAGALLGQAESLRKSARDRNNSYYSNLVSAKSS